MTTAKKSKYYISTDSGSDVEPYEYDSLAEALADFSGVPRHVKTADDFMAWLERIGGHGFIEQDGKIICEVKS